MRLVLALFFCIASVAHAADFVVGSKKFTESYVLGEIAKKLVSDAGVPAQHKQGIGATAIVWGALKSGSIDAYPEYTATISEEILKKPGIGREEMQALLAADGIAMTDDLGFDDNYGIVMKRTRADALGIHSISDLHSHPELAAGPTHEFLDRKDGWRPLLSKYGLNFSNVRAIDHGLGYVALSNGQIDLKDCYTTDAEIKKYDLVVLKDDLGFFPRYKAVFLYRTNSSAKAIAALKTLSGTIDQPLMIAMNAEAGKSDDYAEAASMYFAKHQLAKPVNYVSESLVSKETRWILRHLELVGISLVLSVIIGIPLGIWASRPGTASSLILGISGMIQTIPSLALLALLVPLPFFGISASTAIVALVLYSLLPIVRNTATGISGIPQSLRESAEALGLEPWARMRKIYIPMALPTILAGIKTSAVINVGTATIAALIGTGGLGEPIISGLSLNSNRTILEGAVPAAVLALLVQLAFDALDRALVPRGLRL